MYNQLTRKIVFRFEPSSLCLSRYSNENYEKKFLKRVNMPLAILKQTKSAYKVTLSILGQINKNDVRKHTLRFFHHSNYHFYLLGSFPCVMFRFIAQGCQLLGTIHRLVFTRDVSCELLFFAFVPLVLHLDMVNA